MYNARSCLPTDGAEIKGVTRVNVRNSGLKMFQSPAVRFAQGILHVNSMAFALPVSRGVTIVPTAAGSESTGHTVLIKSPTLTLEMGMATLADAEAARTLLLPHRRKLLSSVEDDVRKILLTTTSTELSPDSPLEEEGGDCFFQSKPQPRRTSTWL